MDYALRLQAYVLSKRLSRLSESYLRSRRAERRAKAPRLRKLWLMASDRYWRRIKAAQAERERGNV